MRTPTTEQAILGAAFLTPADLARRGISRRRATRLVAEGCTNAEIASRLFISPKTADHHVSAVLTKLDLPNRRAVVLRADELGLA